jgi:alkylated DNA repair protein (DNA oxidative demethylase)
MTKQGFYLFKDFLTLQEQKKIVFDIQNAIQENDYFINTTPYGKPYKVINANFGLYGWFSDNSGYHYSKVHPITKAPWPKIPNSILETVFKLTNLTDHKDFKPESCYINFYFKDSSLGLHQDNSEKNLTKPIVSISIGDTAEFLLGGINKKDKLETVFLKSGDCYVQGGESRMCYHQVKGIFKSNSEALPEGGRINLTIRQVY